MKEDLCLHSTTIGDSIKWHARLGHVNFETIKAKISRELVVGIPQITIEKRYVVHVCLLGKQARQAFPK